MTRISGDGIIIAFFLAPMRVKLSMLFNFFLLRVYTHSERQICYLKYCTIILFKQFRPDSGTKQSEWWIKAIEHNKIANI